MKPTTIDGANANPGAPEGWDENRDGLCARLPIRFTERGGIIQHCESAWEPSPEELELLNAGGHVILRVVGWQVPVALSVEKSGGTSCQSRKHHAPPTATAAPDETSGAQARGGD